MMIALSEILQAIWNAMEPYISEFYSLAASVATFLIIIEIVNFAINTVENSSIKVLKLAVTIIFVSGFIVGYNPIVKSFWRYARLNTASQERKIVEYENMVKDALKSTIVISRARTALTLSSPFGMGMNAVMGPSGYDTIFLIQVINAISIYLYRAILISYFTSFALVIGVGPLYLIFLFSSETKNWGIRWIGTFVAHFIVFFSLNIALEIVTKVQKANVYNIVKHKGFPGWGVSLHSIGLTLIIVGVFWAVNRVVNSFTQTSGGGEFTGGLQAAAGVAMAGGAAALSAGGAAGNKFSAAGNIGSTAASTAAKAGHGAARAGSGGSGGRNSVSQFRAMRRNKNKRR